MEFTRKIIFGLIIILFISCKSTSIVVLQEIKPLPKEVVVQKKLEYEPIYSSMKILEVSEVNGIQKFILAKLDSSAINIEIDLIGEISLDSSFSEIIGTFKVTSKSGGFLKGTIITTTHRIPTNSYLRVQIGQQAISEE